MKLIRILCASIEDSLVIKNITRLVMSLAVAFLVINHGPDILQAKISVVALTMLVSLIVAVIGFLGMFYIGGELILNKGKFKAGIMLLLLPFIISVLTYGIVRNPEIISLLLHRLVE